ncbi:MAG: hypothetical protein ABL986_00350 [Vicinamibacterales bacterium]
MTFAIDGVGIATGATWAWKLMAIAAASLLLSVAGWPDARIGVLVNVVLLGLALAAIRRG